MSRPVEAPRISRVRAALTVGLGVTAAGAALGVLWAYLAPPVHGVVALAKSGNRVHTYLGNEADHFFVSAVLMLGLLWVLAVVAPVVAWQWRAHRGPLMVAALSVGAVAAAAAASAVGALLVRPRYDIVDIATAPVTAEHRVYYFVQAPSVFFGQSPWQIAATLLVPAATAALVYALLAVSTGRDDLGAYPPDEPAFAPLPAFIAPSEVPPS